MNVKHLGFAKSAAKHPKHNVLTRCIALLVCVSLVTFTATAGTRYAWAQDSGDENNSAAAAVGAANVRPTGAGYPSFTFTVESSASAFSFTRNAAEYHMQGTVDWGDGSTWTITDSGNGSAPSITVSPSTANDTWPYHAFLNHGISHTVTITPDPNVGFYAVYGSYPNNSLFYDKTTITGVDGDWSYMYPSGYFTNGGTVAPDYAFAYLFSGCTNPVFRMGNDFSISGRTSSLSRVGDGFCAYMFSGCLSSVFNMNSTFNLPQNITSAGKDFCAYMFNRCYGNAFNMNSVFNLPQGIVNVGSGFCANMFEFCHGTAFTMNGVLNIPPGITTIGDDFCKSMFASCFGASFDMNDVITFPHGITAAGNGFGSKMFFRCYGNAFAMNDVFSLPASITAAGDDFCQFMFFLCNGTAFNMGATFNLPQRMTSVGDTFCANMFSNCSGAKFSMNGIFNLPQTLTSAGDSFCDDMFSSCHGGAFTSLTAGFNIPQHITTASLNIFCSYMFGGDTFILDVPVDRATGNVVPTTFQDCWGNGAVKTVGGLSYVDVPMTVTVASSALSANWTGHGVDQGTTSYSTLIGTVSDVSAPGTYDGTITLALAYPNQAVSTDAFNVTYKVHTYYVDVPVGGDSGDGDNGGNGGAGGDNGDVSGESVGSADAVTGQTDKEAADAQSSGIPQTGDAHGVLRIGLAIALATTGVVVLVVHRSFNAHRQCAAEQRPREDRAKTAYGK